MHSERCSFLWVCNIMIISDRVLNDYVNVSDDFFLPCCVSGDVPWTPSNPLHPGENIQDLFEKEHSRCVLFSVNCYPMARLSGYSGCVTVSPSTGNFNIPCAVDGTARIFLMPPPALLIHCGWDGDLITMISSIGAINITRLLRKAPPTINTPTAQMCPVPIFDFDDHWDPLSSSSFLQVDKDIAVSGEKIWVILGLATLFPMVGSSV
ncbi:hypothetical protein Tco_0278091 [Tanacetum coccineum]